MDRGTFLTHFPEFKNTDSRLVDAKLAAAAARMGGPDASIWGGPTAPGQPLTRADLAQGNLAAHYLVTTPFGTEFKLSDDGGKKTPYLDAFEDLQLSAAGGFACSGFVV